MSQNEGVTFHLLFLLGFLFMITTVIEDKCSKCKLEMWNKSKDIMYYYSFPKIEYLDFDALYDYNYPTLVDMNGFNDSSDDLVEELLRFVFFGRLPEGEKLMDAVKLHRFGL